MKNSILLILRADLFQLWCNKIILFAEGVRGENDIRKNNIFHGVILLLVFEDNFHNEFIPFINLCNRYFHNDRMKVS